MIMYQQQQLKKYIVNIKSFGVDAAKKTLR